ncbi:hypothetical protein PG984_005345 [Apiospora sp. TS-2023a]
MPANRDNNHDSQSQLGTSRAKAKAKPKRAPKPKSTPKAKTQRDKSYVTDPKYEKVTEPGDQTLVLHSEIHENEDRLSYYLGYTKTSHLKRAIYSPRVVHATRLCTVFITKANNAAFINKVYREWSGCDDDDAFRLKYRANDSEIHEYVKTGRLVIPDGTEAIRPWCEALVWALELLSEPAGSTHPVWRTAEGEEEAYPESYEKLEGKVLPLVAWNEDTRPNLVHHPEFNESEFEKYLRVLALIRRCRQYLFQADSNKTQKTVEREVKKAEKANRGQNLTLGQKRDLMERCVLSGREKPLDQSQRPEWMVTIRKEDPLKKRAHIVEMNRAKPPPTVDIDYILMPSKPSIVTRNRLREVMEKHEAMPALPAADVGTKALETTTHLAPVGHTVFRIAEPALNTGTGTVVGASTAADSVLQEETERREAERRDMYNAQEQQENQRRRPGFLGEDQKYQPAFYDDTDVSDEVFQRFYARNTTRKLADRLRYKNNHLLRTRKSIFPALSEEQTMELNEQERIDVDSEGMDLIDQAAASLITGSNFTNGLPIDACLQLGAAVPTGKCHNGDKDLKYYHSEVFPAYNDKDGFLAHQITGVMALITRLTGSLIAVEYMGRRGFLKDDKGRTEPVILVCPDIGVALQWYEKINSFTTSLEPFLAHGDSTHDPGSAAFQGLNTKSDGFWDNTNTNAKSKIPVIITTKHTYASRVLVKAKMNANKGPNNGPKLTRKRRNTAGPVNKLTEAGKGFSIVIVDEVHEYRNPSTKVWEAINTTEFKYFLGLTATPIVNEPMKLGCPTCGEQKEDCQHLVQRVYVEPEKGENPRENKDSYEAILNPEIIKKIFAKKGVNDGLDEEIYSTFAMRLEEAFVIRRDPANTFSQVIAATR